VIVPFGAIEIHELLLVRPRREAPRFSVSIVVLSSLTLSSKSEFVSKNRLHRRRSPPTRRASRSVGSLLIRDKLLEVLAAFSHALIRHCVVPIDVREIGVLGRRPLSADVLGETLMSLESEGACQEIALTHTAAFFSRNQAMVYVCTCWSGVDHFADER